MGRSVPARGTRAIALAGLLAVGLGLLACGGPERPYDRIVLVTVNSLRWDHLSGAGYPRPTTPVLDALAAEGAVFERAYAGSATGALSLATLLTGLEVGEHGLRRPEGKLREGVATLAERLAERGWQTAAFVSQASSFRPRGLDRGFVHFDGPPDLARAPYRPADRTVDAALGWLEREGAATPAFVLVQLQDPARPFHPPPVYVDRVSDVGQREEFYAFLEREHALPLGWYAWQHTKLNAVFNNYDGEVRFVDTELGRLREGLQVLGLLERTLLVVTSEHGLGLGNHFWDGAGRFLYEEQVRVPLVFSAGDGSIAPRRIPDVVGHKDLPATLLDLASPHEAADGAEAGSGRSLVPLLRGQTLEARPAFFDRGDHPPLDDAQRRRLARSPNLPVDGPLLGGVEARWKVIDAWGERDEIFDLQEDPREQVDRAGPGLPPEAQALRRAVEGRSPMLTGSQRGAGER
jgi:arylsulfatase A-like enzyme